MKKLKKLIALLLVFTMVFSMAACSNKQNDETTAAETTTGASEQTTEAESTAAEELNNEVVEYYMQKANEVVITDTSVTFTDDSGRGEITIEKNPQNAAVLYGSLACLWYEAGGEAPLLIGGDSAVELYLEQIGRDITQDEGVTVVSESSSGTSWDIETIIANHPDLIVCSMGMKGYESIGSAAEAAGIPVIAIQYDHVQDYLKWFKVFCNINGQPELWAEIANDTAEKIIDVVSRVPENVEKPRVLALGVVSGKLRAYGSAAAVGTILMELDAENVIDVNNEGTTESIEISMEDIYALAPDIIVVNQRGAAGATQQQLAELVENDPVWASLDAVKNDKVIFLDKGLFFNKPNQRYQEAYLTMGAILYPDEFGDEIEIEENYDGVLVVDHEEELLYAVNFSMTHYKGGYISFQILNGMESDLIYLVVPEDMSVPEGLGDEYVILQQPITSIRCCSGSASTINAFGGLDSVTSLGTDVSGLAVTDLINAMNDGKIAYTGSYKEPDYEAIMSLGTQLVIDANLLDGNETVKEKYNELGIPFLAIRNGKEEHPLGYNEWAKVFGAVLGMWDEANAYFDSVVEQVNAVSNTENTGKTVAMLYFSSDGTKVYAARGGDCWATLANLAGGNYVMADFEGDKTGTATITLEDFYAMCGEADYIFNLNMAARLHSLDELLEHVPLLKDCKATKEGHLYCAYDRIYQFNYDYAGMISDMNKILNDDTVDDTTYFHKAQ